MFRFAFFLKLLTNFQKLKNILNFFFIDILTVAHLFQTELMETKLTKENFLKPNLKPNSPVISVRFDQTELNGNENEFWLPAELVFISRTYFDVAIIKVSNVLQRIVIE